MRVTIVGGGVIGLLTAVECVLAGHQVTVVDQGGIPNAQAASTDRHRIVRALHQGDEGATAAAVLAHRRWIQLEQLLYTRFYDRVGALTVLAAEQLADAVSLLANAGARPQVLHPDDLSARYPHLRFAPSSTAVLETEAGVLLADRILAACVGWLRWQARAEVRQDRRAVEVDARTATVQLADGEVLHADAAVIAAGAWSRQLLPSALAGQLVLYRQSMLYCRVQDPEGAWSTTPAVPALGTEHRCWLVPPVASTPLKVSADSACRAVHEVTDHRTDERWRRHLVEVFAQVIRGFDAGWVSGARDCYYLARADGGGPLLAGLGGSVLAYAACGGSSFKFAPLIAKVLAQHVAGGPVEPVGLDALDHPTPTVTTTSGSLSRDSRSRQGDQW